MLFNVLVGMTKVHGESTPVPFLRILRMDPKTQFHLSHRLEATIANSASSISTYFSNNSNNSFVKYITAC